MLIHTVALMEKWTAGKGERDELKGAREGTPGRDSTG